MGEGKLEDWGNFVKQLNALKDGPMSTSNSVDHNAAESHSRVRPQGRGLSHEADADPLCRPIRGRCPGHSEETSKIDISHIKDIIKSKLLENDELYIEILRSDPNNPLHSAKTFQEMGLKTPLLRGIASMKMYKPSTIQEKALPSLIGSSPQNMIAQSQSGTGKTATFLLAMLSRTNPSESYCQCLCMVPTRELALQIVSVGREMAQFIEGISFGLAARDEQVSTDLDGFVTDQIVVGTPGTVARWVRGNGSIRLDISKLIVFVLDEADIMMEQEGFLNISKRIRSKLPPDCQILLFSATYEDEVMDFARELVPNPIEIRVKRTQLPLKNIKQYYILFKDWTEKYAALADIYGDFHIGQAIIFCATRKEASWLEGRMNLDGHRVIVLSGDLEMWQRQEIIEQFRQASFRVLITTNVCSRGLDIPQVNLVINWNMPTTRTGAADCETYLHRIGRSGRFGKEGLAVNFVTADEMFLIDELEQHFQIKIPPLTSEDIAIM